MIGEPISKPPTQSSISQPASVGAPRGRFLMRFAPVLGLVAVFWLVFLINNLLLGGRLSSHGIVPRHPSSLTGVLWAPFLHESFGHLLANTLPFLILGGIVCARSSTQFGLVTVVGVLLGGGLTWVFARSASHIGASGLIFCYFGYLVSRAYFERSILTLLLSLACIIAYGGMLKGIMPTSTHVSWESHLTGLIAGGVAAWLSSLPRSAESFEKQELKP